MNRACLGIALLLAASPLFAQESPAPRDPQDYQPWLANQNIRPGDKWARVLLDLDEHGRPLRCRIAETNVRHGDLRFYFCNAFMGGAFETEPVRQNGVAVRGTIERFLVMPGRNSRPAYEQARRQHRAEQRSDD